MIWHVSDNKSFHPLWEETLFVCKGLCRCVNNDLWGLYGWWGNALIINIGMVGGPLKKYNHGEWGQKSPPPPMHTHSCQTLISEVLNWISTTVLYMYTPFSSHIHPITDSIHKIVQDPTEMFTVRLYKLTLNARLASHTGNN